MRDYQKVFLKAAFNSLLPEFMDSDRLTADSVSPELLAVLRKIGDHYYKDEATTQAHIDRYQKQGSIGRVRKLRAGSIDYGLVNDFFGTQSFFKDFQDQGFATDLKMMLGTFVIKRDGDGYRVTDKYDFSSNPSFVREYIDEIGDVMLDTGNNVDVVTQFKAAMRQSSLNKDKGMMGRSYPFLRVLGNQFAPDTVAPEEGGAQYVDIFIPDEDKVDDLYPSPRPAFFENDEIAPVFPATPMDSERKGLLDMALEAIFPSAAASEPVSPFPEGVTANDPISDAVGAGIVTAGAAGAVGMGAAVIRSHLKEKAKYPTIQQQSAAAKKRRDKRGARRLAGTRGGGSGLFVTPDSATKRDVTKRFKRN